MSATLMRRVIGPVPDLATTNSGEVRGSADQVGLDAKPGADVGELPLEHGLGAGAERPARHQRNQAASEA